MTVDVREIAYQITNDTPQGAAVTIVKLIQAVLDLLPGAYSQGQFIAKLQQELPMLGYRLEQGPQFIYFSHLQIGDRFKTSEGKLYQKIDPIPQPDFRNESTAPLTARDLQTNKPVYIAPNERVEKLE